MTKKRVLVAEDNPGAAHVLQFNLQTLGLDVMVAENGSQALEMAQRESFDMFVTDHEMPEMTGIELSQKLRQLPQYSETPILMITAREIELDTANLFKSLDLAAVLPKPYSPRQLLQLVEGLLETDGVSHSG